MFSLDQLVQGKPGFFQPLFTVVRETYKLRHQYEPWARYFLETEAMALLTTTVAANILVGTLITPLYQQFCSL